MSDRERLLTDPDYLIRVLERRDRQSRNRRVSGKTQWWGEDVFPRFRWLLRVDRIRTFNVPEGEEIEPGYGIAYYELGRDVAVCMPIPINLLVGAWRSLKWHLMCPPWRFTEWRHQRFQERAWDAGYEAGQLREIRYTPTENPYRRTK